MLGEPKLIPAIKSGDAIPRTETEEDLSRPERLAAGEERPAWEVRRELGMDLGRAGNSAPPG